MVQLRLPKNSRVKTGKGRSLAEALAGTPSVVEGVATTRSLVQLAARSGVEMPIAAEAHAILFEGRPPREGLANLMAREGKDESE